MTLVDVIKMIMTLVNDDTEDYDTGLCDYHLIMTLVYDDKDDDKEE